MKNTHRFSGYPILICFLVISLFNLSCSRNDNYDHQVVQEYDGKDIFKGIYFFGNEFVDQIPTLKNSAIANVINKSPELQNNLDYFADLIIGQIQSQDQNFFNDFENLMKSKNQIKITQGLDLGTQKILETFKSEVGDTKYTYNDITKTIRENKLENLIDKDGRIDETLLAEVLKKQISSNFSNPNTKSGDCLAAAIAVAAYVVVVVVAGAAVAVNIAAAVNVAAAVNGYIAINIEFVGDINFGGGGITGGGGYRMRQIPEPPQEAGNSKSLETEMFIDQLTKIEY